MIWIRAQDPSVRASEDSSCDHRDWRISIFTPVIYQYCLLFVLCKLLRSLLYYLDLNRLSSFGKAQMAKDTFGPLNIVHKGISQ
jgi:hypothetical protein